MNLLQWFFNFLKRETKRRDKQDRNDYRIYVFSSQIQFYPRFSIAPVFRPGRIIIIL